MLTKVDVIMTMGTSIFWKQFTIFLAKMKEMRDWKICSAKDQVKNSIMNTNFILKLLLIQCSTYTSQQNQKLPKMKKKLNRLSWQSRNCASIDPILECLFFQKWINKMIVFVRFNMITIHQRLVVNLSSAWKDAMDNKQ